MPFIQFNSTYSQTALTKTLTPFPTIMFFKPNMQSRTEQEQLEQLLLTLILIQMLINLILLIRDWFQQQNWRRKYPLDHDHGKANDSGQPSQFLCGICFDYKPVPDMFKKGKCKHPFCTECISKHVATQIHQNILMVTCPDPNCFVELKPECLLTILPNEVVVKWECSRCEALIVESEKTYCPFKDCSVLLVNDGGEVVTSSECPSCHRLFCGQCKVPWHGDKTCEEFQSKKGNKNGKELDEKFLKLAKDKNWQKCPKCTVVVARRGGCEHITCRCGCNFCYNCGGNWEFGHQCKKRRSK